MTEEEAKTRACCNGASRPAENGSCIGSACMAWRWTGKTAPKSQLTQQVDLAIAVLGTAEQRAELRDQTTALRLGYCGLAGRPE